MRFLQNIPIKRKLTIITMLTSGVALLLACIAFVTYEQITFRHTMASELSVLTDLLDDNVAPGLTFNDPKSIETTLNSLNAHTHILAAAVYDKAGARVAMYQRADLRTPFPVPPAEETGTHFEKNRLDAFRRIVLGGENIGTIYIASDLRELTARFWRYGMIVSLVLILSSFVAFALSAKLQRIISGPISHLAGVASTVAKDKNYSIRATRHGEDELGRLIDGFNEMLNQIQARDGALQEAHGSLERRVESRTLELASSLSLLNATVDSMADGILAVDLKGKVICHNKKYSAMWAVPDELLKRGDYLGLVAHASRQTKDPDQYLKRIQELQARPEVEAFDVFELKDGRTIERYAQPQRIGNECVGRVLNFRDITERKRADEARHQSEARFRQVWNASADGMRLTNHDGLVLMANDAYCGLVRKTKAELEGHSLSVIHQAEERERVLSKHRVQLDSITGPAQMEKEVSLWDGRKVWLDLTNTLLQLPGEPPLLLSIFRDISQRKVAEAELSHERHLMQSLMDHSPDPIYFKDLESRFLKCSEIMAAQIGLKSGAELVGKTDFDFFTEEEARASFEDEQEIIRTGRLLLNKVEKEFWIGTGKTVWSLTNKMPLRNPAGEIIGTFGISKDITAQKNKEEELRRTQAFLNSVVENLPIGVFIKEAKELRFVLWSKNNEELIGLSRSEVMGKNDHDFFTKEEADSFTAKDRETLAQGHLVNITEETIQTRHHGRRTLLTRKVPILDEDGRPAYLLGISEDITDRKRSEEALRHSEERFRSLIENASDIITLVAADGTITYESPSLRKLLGYAPEEVVGQNCLRFIHADDASLVQNVLMKLVPVPNSTATLEFRFRHKDGTWRVLETLGRNLLHDPNVAAIVVNSRDITERKQAELELKKMHQQLLETSRQAGMAEVATSVLHNVGNVLNSVNVSATLLAEHSKKSKVYNLAKVVRLMEEHSADLGAFITNDPKGKQLPGYLAQLSSHLAAEQTSFLNEAGQLRKNVEHIKDIVAMQQSHAKVSGVTEVLKISDLVEDALRMNAGTLIRHEVEVVREFAEVPPVAVDRHKVLQVLVNLIRNAKYACDDSGRTDKRMTVRVAADHEWARIAIIDNGVGIPAENLIRIFNHGFTTRKEGHGFGLHSGALAAKEMGGALHVYSEGVGCGAAFTLELPLEDKSAGAMCAS